MYVCNRRKVQPFPNQEDQKKLAEEKGEISEGIWDLDPAAMEKAEHALSGQP